MWRVPLGLFLQSVARSTWVVPSVCGAFHFTSNSSLHCGISTAIDQVNATAVNTSLSFLLVGYDVLVLKATKMYVQCGCCSTSYD